jgi:hypothetical protein
MKTCGAKSWTAGANSYVRSGQFISKASRFRDFQSDPFGVVGWFGDSHVAVGGRFSTVWRRTELHRDVAGFGVCSERFDHGNPPRAVVTVADVGIDQAGRAVECDASGLGDS